MRNRIAALCPEQPEHRCKALLRILHTPEDRGRNERSQSLSLRSAPGVIPLSLGGVRGVGKAADSGSIIRIDPKSAVYVSDIRPQRVEITSSTACRISATARRRRNTLRKSPTIAAEDNLCCMISCFRVYIFNGYLWFRGIPVCRPQRQHLLSCRRRNSKLRICLCIELGLCICMTLCLHLPVGQVCDGCQRL